MLKMVILLQNTTEKPPGKRAEAVPKYIVERCEKHHVQVVFSHVNEQPMHAMEKAGFVEKVGRENFCSHIDSALERAAKLEAARTAA